MMYKKSFLEQQGFGLYKRESMIAAKELMYPHVAIQLIKKAKTPDEIDRIMADCRNETFSEENYKNRN